MHTDSDATDETASSDGSVDNGNVVSQFGFKGAVEIL